MIQGRVGVDHLADIDENRPGAQDPCSGVAESLIRHAVPGSVTCRSASSCAGERSRPWPGHRGRRERHPRDSARPAARAASGRPGPAATPRAGFCARTVRPGRHASRPGAAARRYPAWYLPSRRERRPRATDRARPARRSASEPLYADLQEQWPLLIGDPGQGADDRVVDECPDLIGRQTGRRVGIEDLEEMPDAERGRLPPERAIRLQRGQVVIQVIVESHRVEHEIAERPDGGQVGRAERPRRRGGIAAAAAVPDVRAVVRPDGQASCPPASRPGPGALRWKPRSA